MQGRVWIQRRVKTLFGSKLECGWITNASTSRRTPKTLSEVKLTDDVEKALRFDVDNNMSLLNSLIRSGYSIIISNNHIVKVERAPSCSPFSQPY